MSSFAVFPCPVCGEDLSSLTDDQRQGHIFLCQSKMKANNLQISHSNKTCPICNKKLSKVSDAVADLHISHCVRFQKCISQLYSNENDDKLKKACISPNEKSGIEVRTLSIISSMERFQIDTSLKSSDQKTLPLFGQCMSTMQLQFFEANVME